VVRRVVDRFHGDPEQVRRNPGIDPFRPLGRHVKAKLDRLVALLSFDHRAAEKKDQILLPALPRSQLDQQRAKVGEGPTSLSLQRIDLFESPIPAVLVSAKRLQLQEHHGKRLGNAVVELAGKKRAQLLGRQVATGGLVWTVATATPGGWSRGGQELEITAGSGTQRVILL
jgi:hypothetical protein